MDRAQPDAAAVGAGGADGEATREWQAAGGVRPALRRRPVPRPLHDPGQPARHPAPRRRRATSITCDDNPDPLQPDPADRRPGPRRHPPRGRGRAAGAGAAGGRRELRGVQGLQHDDDAVRLRREPARPARLPAAEGDVRAARLAVPAAGAGPRGAGPARPGLDGGALGGVAGAVHARPGPAAPGAAGAAGAAARRPPGHGAATGSTSGSSSRWRWTGCAR